METKEMIRGFAIYLHQLPIYFDSESNIYRYLFGKQTLTFDELYEDFLTTLNK
jgi:hypothetical protein